MHIPYKLHISAFDVFKGEMTRERERGGKRERERERERESERECVHV